MTIKLASIITACVIAALIGVDIYFAYDGIKGTTWSEVLRMWGQHLKVVPWALGVLCGHWFHPDIGWHPQQPMGVSVLIWLTWVVQVLSMAFPGIPMLLFVLVGIVAGVFCWPCGG